MPPSERSPRGFGLFTMPLNGPATLDDGSLDDIEDKDADTIVREARAFSRRFTKAAVREVLDGLDKAIREYQENAPNDEGSGVFDEAFAARDRPRQVLGLAPARSYYPKAFGEARDDE